MEKQILREIISDQKKQPLPENVVERENIKKAFELVSTDQILVISGIRRAGKSTFMQQMRQQLPSADCYLSFDDERLLHFTVDDFQKLLEVFIELYGEQKYFYFDEIQNIEGWEYFVRRLHSNGNKIIITGSNAHMLSKEFGTHLTGRYCELKIYPFSFKEYLRYKNVTHEDLNATSTKAILQKHFGDYCTSGGFPSYVKHKQQDYLKSLYDSILYRDIVARYKIRNVNELKELVYYSASNIGKKISFNNIKKLLELGNSTSIKTYFSYLENVFLLFLLPKFDFSLKKQIRANKKIYMIDNALAQMLGFRFSSDGGRLLENLVFIELLRRGKECFYDDSDDGECDFIIRDQGKVSAAIQVCMQFTSASVKERELRGLTNAMQKYQITEGMILTYDTEEYMEDVKAMTAINRVNFAIKVMPAWKWMLMSFSL